MLSKEKIENIICNADFGEGKDKQVDQVWVNVSFLDHITAEKNKYKDKVDHLESREQKLIEKLEEESKQLENDILTMSTDTGNKYSLKLIHQAEGMKKQNDRILEILKKE